MSGFSDKKEKLSKIFLKLNNMLETELQDMFENGTELEKKLYQEELKNQELQDKILDLENKNKDLNERLKSKSASAIWANMQVQLQEKDKQIEDIKKDLEFYKRNYTAKPLENKSVYENNNNKQSEISKQNVKQEVNVEVKQEVKQEMKPEVKQEVEQIEIEVVKVEEVEEVKEVKKKKKKTKSKKVEVVDESVLDDLEKELLN
jgi:hypothetical protein